ncbi:25416_t:CDS:1, partial [Racocetra persica]
NRGLFKKFQYYSSLHWCLVWEALYKLDAVKLRYPRSVMLVWKAPAVFYISHLIKNHDVLQFVSVFLHFRKFVGRKDYGLRRICNIVK